MNKEKEIEEMAMLLSSYGSNICQEACGNKCASKYMDICLDHKKARYAVERGYGNVKQYQDEIDRLETELMHREEDLIHADEKVFYREQAVKLDKDKIKKQAVKEFAERLKKEIIEGDGTCLDEYDIGKQDGYNSACEHHRQAIDDLITELYGAEEQC